MAWHPLHERLSFRYHTLDEDLTSLGISPHPRVVLAVEGETEEVHAPRVWELLGYPDAPELMRLLKLGGVDRDLEKVAALAAAPLVSGRLLDGLAGYSSSRRLACTSPSTPKASTSRLRRSHGRGRRFSTRSRQC